MRKRRIRRSLNKNEEGGQSQSEAQIDSCGRRRREKAQQNQIERDREGEVERIDRENGAQLQKK